MIERIKFYIDPGLQRIKFIIDPGLRRMSLYITHFVDSIMLFIKHVDYSVDRLSASFNCLAKAVSNDIVRAAVHVICIMSPVLLSTDTGKDALRTWYDLQVKIVDNLYVESSLEVEYRYAVAMDHIDYALASAKANYVGNRMLEDYTFAIGQDGMTLYDWMFFDI